MTIPEYQTFMRPVLEVLSDGVERRSHDLTDLVADRLAIPAQEREQLLANGRELKLANRVQWAPTYLVQAELLQRPSRGRIAITDLGRQALTANPGRIDNSVLRQYPRFKDFVRRSESPRPKTAASEPDVEEELAASESPTELLGRAVQQNRASVEGELLQRALAMSPADFERLVLRLLTAMGYGARGTSEHSGRSGDDGIDGIDGIMSQDPLGLDRIYLQAKRYVADNPVDRPAIQGFVGALMGALGYRGIFLTTQPLHRRRPRRGRPCQRPHRTHRWRPPGAADGRLRRRRAGGADRVLARGGRGLLRGTMSRSRRRVRGGRYQWERSAGLQSQPRVADHGWQG